MRKRGLSAQWSGASGRSWPCLKLNSCSASSWKVLGKWLQLFKFPFPYVETENRISVIKWDHVRQVLTQLLENSKCSTEYSYISEPQSPVLSEHVQSLTDGSIMTLTPEWNSLGPEKSLRWENIEDGAASGPSCYSLPRLPQPVWNGPAWEWMHFEMYLN